jgi:hypothetical protein
LKKEKEGDVQYREDELKGYKDKNNMLDIQLAKMKEEFEK